MVNTTPFVFDIETAGADELFRRPDFVRLSGYATPGSRATLTTDAGEVARLIANPSFGPVIGHNITGFDLIALARWHGLDLASLRGRVYDTDLAVRCEDPPPSGKDGASVRPKGYYGLDQSAVRYGVPGKVADLDALAKEYGGHDQIPIDDPRYREYLIGDLRATAGLYKALKPLTTDYIRREMEVGLITAQMTLSGFRVDVDELTRALEEQSKRKASNLRELSEITGMPLGRMVGKKNPRWEEFANPLATKEGKAAILDFLAVRHKIKDRFIPRTEKSGDLSLNGDKIKELRALVASHGAPADLVRALDLIVALVSERTVYQTADTYRVGDRVHPNIRPLQASGRWSVTKPGLTVYGKRKGRHRERRIFLPEPGHVILCFDLDQVDARAVAAHAGDPGYLRIFREGLDLHSENAKVAFGDASRRDDAKVIGHGWNYGMSVKTMVRNGVPEDLAVQFDRNMREAYPSLVEWQNAVRRVAADGDLLDNGFGRKLRAHEQYAYTQAPALVGQGCTRDILAEGLLRLPVELRPFLRVIVHDEIVLSVPEADAQEISKMVLDALQFDLADVTGGRLASCPITAGVSKPGKTWADCYEK